MRNIQFEIQENESDREPGTLFWLVNLASIKVRFGQDGLDRYAEVLIDGEPGGVVHQVLGEEPVITMRQAGHTDDEEGTWDDIPFAAAAWREIVRFVQYEVLPLFRRWCCRLDAPETKSLALETPEELLSEKEKIMRQYEEEVRRRKENKWSEDRPYPRKVFMLSECSM